jgi:GT2 family glycosyltransferase
MNYDLSFVTLTWNSEQYIENFVKSVKSLTSNYRVELIIIDNGSRDLTTVMINENIKESGKLDIKLIANPKNLGTTLSRNQGLVKASGNLIIVCDSDIEFATDGFVEMITYLQNHPEIGILAPKLKLGSGKTQQSIKPIPLFKEKMAKLFKILSQKDARSVHYYDLDKLNEPTAGSTAISAFWVLHKETIREIGLFDEKIFYSPEDIDYSLRCWLALKPVVYYPAFYAIHYTQQITHQSPFSWIGFTHLRDLTYFYWKYRFLNDSTRYEVKIKRIANSHDFKHVDDKAMD